MNPQSAVMRASSAPLRVALVKRVSVSPYVVEGVPGVTGRAWMVVPKAAMPVTSKLFPVPTVEALQEAAVVPVDATSLTTMDVGTPGVRVLLIKSLRAERETSAFGVTRQEQQDINCSSGENVYTFAHRLPFWVGNETEEPAPVLVMLTTESPMARFDAYRTWNGPSDALTWIVVGSLAVSSASEATPLPVTVALLVTDAGAFGPTFTVSVMAGKLANAASTVLVVQVNVPMLHT